MDRNKAIKELSAQEGFQESIEDLDVILEEMIFEIVEEFEFETSINQSVKNERIFKIKQNTMKKISRLVL